MSATQFSPDDYEDASRLLAILVADTKIATLTSDTIEAARYDALDTIGCAIAGAHAPGVREVREYAIDEGGPARSSVWGSGSRIGASSAAFANAMAGHALDFDDNHPGVLHTGVSVIPATIATAEANEVDDISNVLLGIVVGTEIADRLAVATSDGPGVTGWLLSPLCGFFGAAAAASQVLGLSIDEAQSALGLAYVQASGNGQSTLDGALAKRMQPAFASRGGVVAAQLAQRGLTGPANSLEGLRGYFHVYHQDRYDRAALTTPIGESWMIEHAMYKPYPCCGWTHTSLECGLALRNEGIDPIDIVSVDIGVNGQGYKSTGTPLPRRYNPQTTVDAQFSIPFIFSNAMIKGGVEIGDLNGEGLTNGPVLDLAKKVRVSVDAELDKAHGRTISPAHVTVTLRSGDTRETTVLVPFGWEGRPVSHAFLEEKFDMCCREGGVQESVAGELRELILKATGSGSATRLFELLGASR